MFYLQIAVPIFSVRCDIINTQLNHPKGKFLVTILLPCIHVIVLDELFIIKSNTWALVICTCQSLVSMLFLLFYSTFFHDHLSCLPCILKTIFIRIFFADLSERPFFATTVARRCHIYSQASTFL